MVGSVIVPHRRLGHRRKPLAFRLAALGVVATAVVVFLAIRGCQTTPAAPPGRELVTIAGHHFFLEPALDEPTRVRGLGGRPSIEPTGGMLFVFPFKRALQFVMRDCETAIDIAFLDDTGRIVRMYEMPTEPARGEGESAGDYEMRLKRYGSDFDVRYVVEVAPGTWRRLGVKPGDQITFDLEGLKGRAR